MEKGTIFWNNKFITYKMSELYINRYKLSENSFNISRTYVGQ